MNGVEHLAQRVDDGAERGGVGQEYTWQRKHETLHKVLYDETCRLLSERGIQHADKQDERYFPILSCILLLYDAISVWDNIAQASWP